MAIVEIDKKNEDKILIYTRKISTLHTSGSIEGFKNLMDYDKCLFILGHLIKKIGDIEINNSKKRAIIKIAVNKINQDTDISTFKKQIENAYISLKEKPKNQFYVIYPINIEKDCFGKIKYFELKNFRIKICCLDHIVSNFKFDRAMKELSDDTITQSKYLHFTYLVVEQKDPDIHAALKNSSYKIDIMRAIFNFYRSYGTFTRRYGVPIHYCRVQPSKHVFVFNDAGEEVDHTEPVGDYEQNIEIFNHLQIADIFRWTKKINKLKENELKNLLFKCFIKYNDALDESRESLVFFNLWHVLELIALCDIDNLKQKEVISRIKQILLDENDKELCEALREKRNMLAHKGNFSDFNFEDVNEMRNISEKSIMFLLYVVNLLQTKDQLSRFYKRVSLPTTDLKKDADVIKMILNKRK